MTWMRWSTVCNSRQAFAIPRIRYVHAAAWVRRHPVRRWNRENACPATESLQRRKSPNRNPTHRQGHGALLGIGRATVEIQVTNGHSDDGLVFKKKKQQRN